MIFGHLPAGYITSKLLSGKLNNCPFFYKTFMFWGFFGAVAPDTDLLYSLLIDHAYHHNYVTHFPIFWLTLLLISLLRLPLDKTWSKIPASCFIFTLNGFIHLILDTITGHILWLAPFRNEQFSLITESSGGAHYFTQWGFCLELFLIFWALFLWLTSSIREIKHKESIA
jgi:LexA-binding, inner membrane-associated putative hydrolase